LDHVLTFLLIFSKFYFFISFFILDTTQKILGKGGEGFVYLGKHEDTGFEYAMKEFFVKKPEDAVKVKNEVEIIRKLPSSPYVEEGGSLQEFILKMLVDQPLEEGVLSLF
jgi:serine/threonine protein kinase